MKRLHVLFQHGEDNRPYGCSEIRLLRPLSHPSLTLGYNSSWGTELPDEDLDVVIVERLWKPGTDVQSAQRVVRTVRERGAKFIFTLDDDLLELGIPHKQANAIRYFARSADGVIVSTSPLAERMRRLNHNVVVVPNQIDETLFGPPPQPQSSDGAIVFGYMGTPTHLHDLLTILAPLRSVLRRHADRVRLEFVGISERPQILDLFEGLPVTLRSAAGHISYERFVPWMKKELKWNFAIAPLRGSVFNRSKSDLKYLDYGALAIPGIFSAVAPYVATVKHGSTGLLAGNASDWEKQLERMIFDAPLRDQLATNARDHVYQERSLENRAADWGTAIDQLIIASV